MAVQTGRNLWGGVAVTALAAVILVVVASQGGAKVELEETALYIVPQANVLTGSGQRQTQPLDKVATPTAGKDSSKKLAGTQKLFAEPQGKKADTAAKKPAAAGKSATKAVSTNKVAHMKHQVHRHHWNSIQEKVAEQVKAAMEKRQEKQNAAAQKAASADYWKNVKSSINSEKHKEHKLRGSRALERAMAEEQEADKQDEDQDRTMALDRATQERKSEMAQETEDAGEKAFKDLSTRDAGLSHAQLHYSSMTHCGRACRMARSIVS